MFFPINFFLYPAVLWLILFVVARHQGNSSYSTLFYVSLAINIVAFLSAACDPILCLIFTPIVSALVIHKFCYIGWSRTILATILFMGWIIGWPILLNQMGH